MKPKKAKTLTNADAWRMGVELACELLERSAGALNEMALSDVSRGGRPQDNLVLGYLQKLQALNDERVTEAFSAALSDFVAANSPIDAATARHDCGYLRRDARRPIAMRATTADPVTRRVRAMREAQREASGETKH